MDPVTARVLSWDYREQPDITELAKHVLELSGGAVHITNVDDTGCDAYAIVIADRPYSQSEAELLAEKHFAAEGW